MFFPIQVPENWRNVVHHIARLHPPRAHRVHTRHSVALAPSPGLRPLRWPTWHRGDVGARGSWALWPRHPEEMKQLKHQETAGTYGGTQGIPKIVSHHGSPQPSSTLILSMKIDMNIYEYDILFQLQWFFMFFLHPTTSAPSDLSVLPLIDREPTALGLVGTWISHSAVPVAGFLRHAPGQLWSLLDDVRWDSDFDGALLQPCARHFEIGRSSTCPEAKENKRSSFKNGGGPMIKKWWRTHDNWHRMWGGNQPATFLSSQLTTNPLNFAWFVSTDRSRFIVVSMAILGSSLKGTSPNQSDLTFRGYELSPTLIRHLSTKC